MKEVKTITALSIENILKFELMLREQLYHLKIKIYIFFSVNMNTQH